MVEVSNAWKEAMDISLYFLPRAECTLTSGDTVTLDLENLSASGNSLSTSAGTGGIPIGEAVCTQLGLTIVNDGEFDNTDFVGAKLQMYTDFNGESTTHGQFTCISANKSGGYIILVCNDDMYKTDKPFDLSITYPITAGAMFSQCCAACGLVPWATTFRNSDFSIKEAPSGNYTYRNILGYIAQIAGGNLIINRRGEAEIKEYDFNAVKNLTGPYHDISDWINLSVDNADIVITGVTTSYTEEVETEPDEDGNTETTSEDRTILIGEKGYVLSFSNPLAAGNEQTFMQLVASVFNGGSFRKFSADLQTYPLAEFMDLVKTTDQNGNVSHSVISEVVFNYFGSTTLTNTGETASESSSTYLGAGTKTLIEAEKLVAAAISAQNLEAMKATIIELHTNMLTVDSVVIKDLLANSMKVDFANIAYEKVDVSNIATLFAQVGLIDRATIVDGHITGFLDAVEINANNITAGTLIAERIALVQTDEDGNQTGLIYALNNLGELTSESVDTIDGAVITKRTITADHIVAHALTANEIDVENLFAQEVTATNLTISENSRLNGVSATDLIVSGNSVFSGKIVGKAIDISAFDPDSGLTYGIRSSDGRVRINMLYGTNSGATGIPTVGDKVTIHNSITGDDVTAIVTSVVPNSDGSKYDIKSLENGYRTWMFCINSEGILVGGIEYYTRGGYYDETTGETTTGEAGYISGTISAPNGWGSAGEAYIEVSEGIVNIVSDAVNIIATDIALTADLVQLPGSVAVSKTLTLSSLVDASGTNAPGEIPLIIGDPTGQHLEFDNNEIMSKASADKVAGLYLNNDGGPVFVNGVQVVTLSQTQDLTNKTYNGYTLAAACARGVKTLTAKGDLGWGTNNNYLADLGMLAYWNGAYASTNSNLTYCANGTIIGTNNLASNLPSATGNAKGCICAIRGIDAPTASTAANSVKSYSVSFGNTFPSTPGVVITEFPSTAPTSAYAATHAQRKCVVTSVTTTGFTYYAINNTSSTFTPRIRWLAFAW